MKEEGFLAVRCHNNGVAQGDRLWSVNLRYEFEPISSFQKMCVVHIPCILQGLLLEALS